MKTLNNNSAASHPGGVRLCEEKLRRFHPKLYWGKGWLGDLWRVLSARSWELTRIQEHLWYGDSRAAVVISLSPLLVAAYTDELDCVAMLHFSDALVREYDLQVGTRLLTVNIYYPRFLGRARDLEPGERDSRQYGNFVPYIAEFLSEDRARIEQRKAEIDEDEWSRTLEMGRRYLAKRGHRTRDGRPLRCSTPA